MSSSFSVGSRSSCSPRSHLLGPVLFSYEFLQCFGLLIELPEELDASDGLGFDDGFSFFQIEAELIHARVISKVLSVDCVPQWLTDGQVFVGDGGAA